LDVHILDPLTDPRWPAFLERNADASVFHTREWLQALRKTYDYTPLVYTTCPPGKDLTNGIVFCRIQSWLTGKRLVSLPFSDHCEPLVDSPETLDALLRKAAKDAREQHLKRVEIRPLSRAPEKAITDRVLGRSDLFTLHRIDLSPDLDAIYARFHNDCIRRKIKRAEKENLAYEDGTSDKLLDAFYSLLLFTRRKHQIPPQPRQWYRNVLDCMGGRTKIRLVSKDGRPAAAIVTARFGDTHYYKYGCSDPTLANLGGTPLLFWRAVTEAKHEGARWFDLGRSDLPNEGLIAFKDRLGAERSELAYYSTSAVGASGEAHEEGWKMRLAKGVFARLPDKLLVAVGGMLYRHMG
jgi:CelD/BcsL family acetyltransferase involved in cellulose biosynthesis